MTRFTVAADTVAFDQTRFCTDSLELDARTVQQKNFPFVLISTIVHVRDIINERISLKLMINKVSVCSRVYRFDSLRSFRPSLHARWWLK